VARNVSGVRDVRLEDGGFRIVLEGEDEAAVRLLAALVQANVPVLHFAEAKSKLEDVFMAITGGEER
jgi:ABC-2 type transport system ATP-binding protein